MRRDQAAELLTPHATHRGARAVELAGRRPDG